MKSRVLLAFLLVTLGVSAWAAETRNLSVLAMVAGRAISDRAVTIDAYLENPKLFKGSSASLKGDALDSGLQRVITQYLVLEEGKLLGLEKISGRETETRLVAAKKTMGAKLWREFLSEFELNESEIRERYEQKIQVEAALASRVRLATSAAAGAGQAKTADAREEVARKAVNDWLKQLRSRYRVQMFRIPDAGTSKKSDDDA